MNTIPIKMDGKTVDVNPFQISFPYNDVIHEFGEKVWDTASFAKSYFDRKKIIESDGCLAHRYIQYGSLSLSIVSGIAFIGSFVLFAFEIPMIALVAIIGSMILCVFFGITAHSSGSVRELLQSFPETKKHMESMMLDNVAFLRKDKSELNSKIQERIQKIDVVIKDMGHSYANEFINKKDQYIRLREHIKVARKYLLDIGIV